MNKQLLDDDEFSEKIDEFGNEIEEFKLMCGSISKAAGQLKADTSIGNYNQMTELQQNLNVKSETIKSLLNEIANSSKGSDSRAKQNDKVQNNGKKALQEYESRKNEYEGVLRNNVPANLPKSAQRTTSGGEGQGAPKEPTLGERRSSDVPVMMAYNQTAFIEKRQKDIERLHSDAKELKEIAGNVNAKIYEGDEKLDNLNSKLEKNVVNNLKHANEDLAKAEEITKARTKNYCMFSALVGVGVLIIGLSIYFIFK